MTKVKKIIIWADAILLTLFNLANIFIFGGAPYFVYYLIYTLPALFAVLYLMNPKNGKSFRIGVILAAILSVLITIFIGGQINFIFLISYLLFIIAVF